MSSKLNIAIAVAGIDIGKNSFHVIGLDKRGAIVLRQKWSRGQVEARLANTPPRRCACRRAGGGRHGREPEGRGSTEIRGTTPCKTNCPCTSAGGVGRGKGAEA